MRGRTASRVSCAPYRHLVDKEALKCSVSCFFQQAITSETVLHKANHLIHSKGQEIGALCGLVLSIPHTIA